MPTLHLPDQLARWPWPRALNPNYDTVAAESAAWLRSFEAFPPHVQHAFDKCNFGLLASLAYPRLSKEHLRIGCDLMNVFFVIEEFTDDASPEATDAVGRTIMDALRHPAAPRPPGEWVGGEIARQFWANAVRTASDSAQARFLGAFQRYLAAVVDEAADRVERSPGGRQHSVESYLALRRETIGCWPSFALLGLGTDLPDDVVDQAVVAALARLATEMILIGNDLVSYNKERATGAAHNLVTVVLRRPPPGEEAAVRTPQDAVDWVVRYHGALERRFLVLDRALIQSKAKEARSDPRAAAMLDYVDGLGNWVRANDQWSFESARYFGARGLEVMKTRTVELLACEDDEEIAGEQEN